MNDQTNPHAVRVKPLVWELGIVDYAKPLPGMKYFSCSTTPHGCWDWWPDGDNFTRTVERDEQHAKAAADYDAQIMAAIEPAPDPRNAVIAQLVGALETIADGNVISPSAAMNWHDKYIYARIYARDALAAAKAVMK